MTWHQPFRTHAARSPSERPHQVGDGLPLACCQSSNGGASSRAVGEHSTGAWDFSEVDGQHDIPVRTKQSGHPLLILLPVLQQALSSSDIVLEVVVHDEPDSQAWLGIRLHPDIVMCQHVVRQCLAKLFLKVTIISYR
jgi:hypothetical protein